MAPVVINSAVPDQSSFGVAPGPSPFNGKAWDNPVRYKLNRAYGDEFIYPGGIAQMNRRWANRGFSSYATQAYCPPGSSAMIHFDAQASAIYIPAPAGDFEIALQYTLATPSGAAASNVMIGPMIVDATGAGYGCSQYGDNNAYLWRLSAWAYTGTGPLVSGAGTSLYGKSPQWALLKKSGTSYSARFSADGSTFLGPTSTDSAVSFTPAYIGIGRFWSNDPGVTIIDRFNVYPAASFFPG